MPRRTNRSKPALATAARCASMTVVMAAMLSVTSACESDGGSSGSRSAGGDRPVRASDRNAGGSVVVSDVQRPTIPMAGSTTTATPRPESAKPESSKPDAGATGDAAAGDAPRPSTLPVVQRFARPDGLVVEDLRVGEGDVCIPGSTITFKHRAFLPSGVQWEQSHTDDPPASVALSRAMPGWREGIPGMRVGGLRRLTIPPALGFGVTGRRPGPDGPAPGVPVDANGWIVPPGTVLTYEIELLAVRPPAFAAPAAPATPPEAKEAPKADERDMNK